MDLDLNNIIKVQKLTDDQVGPSAFEGRKSFTTICKNIGLTINSHSLKTKSGSASPSVSLCINIETDYLHFIDLFPPSGEIYHLPDHEGPQVYSFCRHHTQVSISSIGLVLMSSLLAQRLEALQHGNQRRLRLENSGLWSSTPYRCRDDWVTKKMTKILESK